MARRPVLQYAICWAVAAAQVAMGTSDADPVGEHHPPLEHLHPAHRAADHAGPPVDAERVGQPGLHPHHVADRSPPGSASRSGRAGRAAATPGRWCPGSRRGRWRTRRTSGRCRWPCPGRSAASHQPRVGWPGPAGPAAWAVAGEGVADQDGVRPRRRRGSPHVSKATVMSRSWPPPSSTKSRSTAVRMNCRSPVGSLGRQAPLTGSVLACGRRQPDGREGAVVAVPGAHRHVSPPLDTSLPPL